MQKCQKRIADRTKNKTKPKKNNTHTLDIANRTDHIKQESTKTPHRSSIIYIFTRNSTAERGELSQSQIQVEPWGIIEVSFSSQAQEKSSQVGHSEHAQNKTAGGISDWEENNGAPWPLNDSKNPVKTSQDPPMIPISKIKSTKFVERCRCAFSGILRQLEYPGERVSGPLSEKQI